MDRYPILKLRLQGERHVVQARQRARDIAVLLGFDRQDQVRIATATSELARNAFRYAHDGTVEFLVNVGQPQCLLIRVCDRGPGIPHLDSVLGGTYESKTGMGKGLTGTRRLMSRFHIDSTAQGTIVEVSKELPAGAPVMTPATVKALTAKLALSEVDPFAEVERQNQELLRTLEELREKQELLARVNSELEDTNRGVVALYAELEQNASDLRRISDQKTSFLSNLSHEFRTPLNSILALCQILHSRADGDLGTEQEKQVDYIRRSASDLSDLVNDLLDVAKVEAGKVDVKPTNFALVDLFGALRGMLRTLLTSTRVDLIFSDAQDLPPLFTDEGKLSQVLRNLISNALKFTERGHVYVSAEVVGEVVLLKVADTGIGIADGDQERIFEEFVQISGSIQNRVRGTGLGLPLSRKLTELLGGTLTVASEPGLGSTFTVRLPMRYGEAAEEAAPLAPRPGNAQRVLVVEDNTESRIVHQSALKASPYTLLFARNLAEAQNLLDAESPDAVVLDRMLEGHDSLLTLQQWRSAGYRGKVLVISVVDELESALDAGADAFLSKPIAPGTLAGKLAELLGAPRARTVLLVDDDEINRYVLREALLPFALHILEAHSGREALEMIAKHAVDAVFLDLAMPGLTGIETLRELRASAKTAHLPVIIHTSKDLSPDDLGTLHDLHATQFAKSELNSPVAAVALRAVLQEAGVL